MTNADRIALIISLVAVLVTFLITENIFERNMFTRADQPALIWEPNEPDEPGRILTYGELFIQVKKFANVLTGLGINKGDRVAIYMPMVPELVIAMLACARIGAIHSVVFAGFSANSLADRIVDANAKLVLTSDGAYRGKKTIQIKEIVDEALAGCPMVESVVVYRRTGENIQMKAGRDIWWHEIINGTSSEHKAVETDAEDMLFILYTSGSTDKPKGIVHTCGGYMVYSAYTFRNVFQYGRKKIPEPAHCADLHLLIR